MNQDLPSLTNDQFTCADQRSRNLNSKTFPHLNRLLRSKDKAVVQDLASDPPKQVRLLLDLITEASLMYDRVDLENGQIDGEAICRSIDRDAAFEGVCQLCSAMKSKDEHKPGIGDGLEDGADFKAEHNICAHAVMALIENAVKAEMTKLCDIEIMSASLIP